MEVKLNARAVTALFLARLNYLWNTLRGLTVTGTLKFLILALFLLLLALLRLLSKLASRAPALEIRINQSLP